MKRYVRGDAKLALGVVDRLDLRDLLGEQLVAIARQLYAVFRVPPHNIPLISKRDGCEPLDNL